MMSRKNKLYFITMFAVVLALSLFMMVLCGSNITNAKAETDYTFAMVSGAQIRADEPYGIRFKAQIGGGKYREIMSEEDGVSKKVGMFIFPASYIANANAFINGETDKVAGEFSNLKQKLEVVFYDSNNSSVNNIYCKDGTYFVNGVIKDLYLQNYDRQFVGVAYVAETEGANTTYEYATLKSDYLAENARSAAQIAYLDNQNGSSAPSDVMKGYMIGDYLIKKGVTQEIEDDTLKFVYDGIKYDSQKEVEEAIGVDYSIELSKTSSLLLENKNETLGVKFANEDASDLYLSKYVDWESSENSVATVEDGEVSAVKLGKTTVKATLFDMQNSCEVTVSNLYGNTKLLNDFEQSGSITFIPDTPADVTRFKTHEDSTEQSRSGNSSYKIVSTPSSNNDAADFAYFKIKDQILKANDVISFWVYVDSLDEKVSSWTQILHSAALSPLSDGTSGSSMGWIASGYLKVGAWSYVSYKLTANDVYSNDGHAMDGAIKFKTNSRIWYDGMSNKDESDPKSITFYIDDIYLNEYDQNNNAFIYDTAQMSYYGGENRRALGPCTVDTGIYYADSIDMDNSSIKKTVYTSATTNVTSTLLKESYGNQTGDSKYDTCPFTLLNVAEYVDGNYLACRPMMQPFANKTKTELSGYTIEFWVYSEKEADIIALERIEDPWAVWTAYTDNIYHINANEWTKISYTYADSNIIGLNIGTFTGGCNYYIDGVVIRG